MTGESLVPTLDHLAFCAFLFKAVDYSHASTLVQVETSGTATMMRRAYVRAMRVAARVMDRMGADAWLARRGSRAARYVRSLAAIHDLERMVSLDAPWWTYRAASRVERFLEERGGRARVFEFGAGASTIWLAQRSGEVHSVEHDATFAAELEPMVKGFDNLELRCAAPRPRSAASTAVSGRRGHTDLDFESYVGAIAEVGGQFDVIVVDGRARPACLDRCLPHLADDGLVVFDNANRARYRSAIARSGLEVEYLWGWAPALPYPTVTAILRRPS